MKSTIRLFRLGVWNIRLSNSVVALRETVKFWPFSSQLQGLVRDKAFHYSIRSRFLLVQTFPRSFLLTFHLCFTPLGVLCIYSWWSGGILNFTKSDRWVLDRKQTRMKNAHLDTKKQKQPLSSAFRLHLPNAVPSA